MSLRRPIFGWATTPLSHSSRCAFHYLLSILVCASPSPDGYLLTMTTVNIRTSLLARLEESIGQQNKIGSAGMAVPHLTVALFPYALCPVDVRETNIQLSFVTFGGAFRRPEPVFWGDLRRVLVAFGRNDGLW